MLSPTEELIPHTSKVLVVIVYILFSHKTWTKIRCRNPSESLPVQNSSSTEQQFHVFWFVFFPRTAITEKIRIIFQEQFVSLILHAQKEHENKTRWILPFQEQSLAGKAPSDLSLAKLLGSVKLLLWGVKTSKVKIIKIIIETLMEGKKGDKLKTYCYKNKKKFPSYYLFSTHDKITWK